MRGDEGVSIRTIIYSLIAMLVGGLLAGVIATALHLPDQWAMLLGMLFGGGFTCAAIALTERAEA
jgi:ABC-type uncharacterized transport system permease subunit